MKNDKPLLSICIPTWNRDYLIKECLNHITPIGMKYNIKIYVSDNASTDNTENVVKDFISKFSNIYYHKQKENIGELNFESVLKQSDTKYRWLFGDNTRPSEMTVKTIIDDLSEEYYDVYICGGRTYGMAEKVYVDHNELLSDLGWHMTWLSCLIYNEKLIKKGYFERYYGSNFIQTGVVFEYCSNHQFKCKFNPKSVLDILKTEKKATWFPTSSIEIFCKKWFLFVMSLPVNYCYEAKKKCIMDHGTKSLLFSLFGLFRLRGTNAFNIKNLINYRYFITQTIKYPYIVLLLICLIPSCVFSLIFLCRKKLYHIIAPGFLQRLNKKRYEKESDNNIIVTDNELPRLEGWGIKFL